MSNAQKFVHEALGATGFAVLRGQVAYTQRPDLWATGSDASYDFMEKNLHNRLGSVRGCKTYLARFEGIDGLVRVLSRSRHELEQRIQWITGLNVTLLIHESEMEGQRDLDAIPERKAYPAESTEGGDLYAGVTTAEPGRTCTQCEWSAHGSGCRNSEESGIRYPALNAPRRCLAYRPRFESSDGRLGVALWPELVALTK